MMNDEPREVYLVAGGTPAARWLAEQLDDPVKRAELEESVRRFAERLQLTIRPVIDAALRQAEAIGRAYAHLGDTLRDAGALPEEPPDDPRERALWLRQQRGTGPDRQVQRQHRPRRVS